MARIQEVCQLWLLIEHFHVPINVGECLNNGVKEASGQLSSHQGKQGDDRLAHLSERHEKFR